MIHVLYLLTMAGVDLGFQKGVPTGTFIMAGLLRKTTTG